MPANENINFGRSASDLSAIEQADKSAAKLDTQTPQAPSSGQFSAWNCPYAECVPRQQ